MLSYRLWFTVCVPVDPSATVYPSGAERAACCVPMMPAAPPLLMTTTLCLRASPMPWASGRATRSVPPPAGKGTMNWMGWSAGYPAAQARPGRARAAPAMAAAEAARKCRRLMPLCGALLRCCFMDSPWVLLCLKYHYSINILFYQLVFIYK
ncbi:hypothetical protein D3C72_1837980 [compost metagenome]